MKFLFCLNIVTVISSAFSFQSASNTISSVFSLQSASNTTSSRRLIGSNSECGTTRLRKSWTGWSQAERSLYLSAVEEAIAQGFHQAMIKVHQDNKSELEAHGTCGFTLWHRRYVLVYENMLRSLKPEFKCVTVPFWNVMDDFNKQHDGECDNFIDCSAILTGIGGVPTGQETRTYLDNQRTGACYPGRPYLDYPDDNGETGCMIRDDLTDTPVVGGASYVSLFSMITSNTDYSTFTRRLQNGIHNEVHATVGGTFGSFGAPADVLFYSWHSTVDMLHYIWHHCHLKAPINSTGISTSVWNFNGANQECRLTKRAINGIDASLTVSSKIHMEADGMDVTVHEKLKAMFADVGTTYGDYVDTRSLSADYTYDYEIPLDFFRILNDDDMCPGYQGTGEVPDVTTPGDDSDDLTYWEWYEQTKAQLEVLYPDDPAKVTQQLEYLDCLGINETFGVPESVGDESLQGSIIANPHCATILDAIENDSTLVDSRVDEKKWGDKVSKDVSKNKLSSAASTTTGLSVVTVVVTMMWATL